MKKIYKPAQPLGRVGQTDSAFSLMNNQFLSNSEITNIKPYLNSVALQDQYKIAAVRAQLALGWLYAQKATSTKVCYRQFYLCKAKQYLSNVALQDVYPKGAQCAVTLLQTLASI
jgi:hypothetical protein